MTNVHPRRSSGATWASWAFGLALVVASGCNPDLITYFLGGFPTTGPDIPKLAVTFVTPVTTQSVSAGAPAKIQWADIASITGTFITLKVNRVDPATREVITTITLIPSRDAIGDGDNDIFEWNVDGVIVGSYQPVIAIFSPEGGSQTTSAPGDFNVTSAIPAPTLTFTNPGASNVNVANPGTLNITWTDNGSANPDTEITLQLDPTAGTPGDERTIAQNIPAAPDNTGSFLFNRTDVNGNPIAPGTYTLNAILVDGIHDNGQGGPITVSAVGKVILDP